MATIKARRQANGTIRYTAVVRRRAGKTILHCQAKTFTHRSAAMSWARHREVELEKEAISGHKPHAPVSLAECIRWYIDSFWQAGGSRRRHGVA
jgi:hypothetical protein